MLSSYGRGPRRPRPLESINGFVLSNKPRAQHAQHLTICNRPGWPSLVSHSHVHDGGRGRGDFQLSALATDRVA